MEKYPFATPWYAPPSVGFQSCGFVGAFRGSSNQPGFNGTTEGLEDWPVHELDRFCSLVCNRPLFPAKPFEPRFHLGLSSLCFAGGDFISGGHFGSSCGVMF